MSYFFVAGLMAAMAWWQIKRGRRFAGRWALAASIFHLLFLPIGPFVTLAGLLVFLRRKQREAIQVERPPDHTPKEGDGTSRFTQGAFFTVSWVFAIAGFRWVDHLAAQSGLTSTQGPLTGILALPLAILLSIFFHELGHALGAWASGFQVRMFRVGPFSFTKLEGKWRFGWAGLLGGATAALPSKAHGIRSGALFIIAAGPVASFVTGTLCLVLFLTARNSPWQSAWDLLGTMAVLCLIDSVINLLPVGTSNGGYSDGARLWQLALNGPWCTRIIAQFYTGLSITADLSPADWPTHLVEESARIEPGTSGDPHSVLLAFVHLRFRGETERARGYYDLINQYESKWPQKDVTQFAPELAFYEAFYNANAEAAQRWFERFKDQAISDYWRALAALHGVRGEFEAGRAAWHKGWSLVYQAPPSGLRLIDEQDFRWMAELWWPDLASLAPIRQVSPSPAITSREAVVV
ncbi:M50 family metallopeptidase [Paludibaculum fermentans]|uniref:M50 family metallopeptidase n=1 Tax=Paludibaculum fermentans TaxID=1473598 RepID=UPI003EBA670A